MNIEYLEAPEGIEATYYEADGKLCIALSPDLDELPRRRFIAEAKAWYRAEHRRFAIPFVLPAGRHRTAGQQTAVVAGAILVAGAVAAAAAVMAPAAFDGNSDHTQRQPARAAAPPGRPGPSGGPGSSQPTSPGSPPPARSAPSNTTPPWRSSAPKKPAPQPARHGHGKPPLGLPSTLPSLPVKLPPVTEPSGPVTVTTPRPQRGLCIRIDLGIQVRIGCGKR